MSPPELDDLKRQLLVAASVEDPTERLLEVAAVVSDALVDLGIQPVVVGGLALAYWSSGGEYITGDIDVLASGSTGITRRAFTRRPISSSPRRWTARGSTSALEKRGFMPRSAHCVR